MPPGLFASWGLCWLFGCGDGMAHGRVAWNVPRAMPRASPPLRPRAASAQRGRTNTPRRAWRAGWCSFQRLRMSRPGGAVFVADHGENRRPRTTSRPSKALSELSGSTRSQLGRGGVARRDAVARAALQARELAPADELDRGVEVGEGHLRVRQRRHIWRRAELGLNPHHAAAAAAVAVAAARLRSASRPEGLGGGGTGDAARSDDDARGRGRVAGGGVERRLTKASRPTASSDVGGGEEGEVELHGVCDPPFAHDIYMTPSVRRVAAGPLDGTQRRPWASHTARIGCCGVVNKQMNQTQRRRTTRAAGPPDDASSHLGGPDRVM